MTLPKVICCVCYPTHASISRFIFFIEEWHIVSLRSVMLFPSPTSGPLSLQMATLVPFAPPVVFGHANLLVGCSSAKLCG